MVALGDMPGDELGLLQALAEIGQHKHAHEPNPKPECPAFSVALAKAGGQSSMCRPLRPLDSRLCGNDEDEGEDNAY